MLFSVPYYFPSFSLLLGKKHLLLVALICGMTCPDTENRLLTCCFYKLSPGRSVLFIALVTGLLQSLKCKENKCSKLSISLKPCRQWAKYCGIALVNSNLFCGFALCPWIRQYYLFKDSASGFHS